MQQNLGMFNSTRMPYHMPMHPLRSSVSINFNRSTIHPMIEEVGDQEFNTVLPIWLRDSMQRNWQVCMGVGLAVRIRVRTRIVFQGDWSYLMVGDLQPGTKSCCKLNTNQVVNKYIKSINDYVTDKWFGMDDDPKVAGDAVYGLRKEELVSLLHLPGSVTPLHVAPCRRFP